jgi:hypothetical protein
MMKAGSPDLEALAHRGDVAGLMEAALQHPSGRMRYTASRALRMARRDHAGRSGVVASGGRLLASYGARRHCAAHAARSAPVLTGSLVAGTVQDGMWESEVAREMPRQAQGRLRSENWLRDAAKQPGSA